MKTSLATGALAGALLTGALPLAAHAQGSITLYGRIDAGVEYASGMPTGSGQTTGSGKRFSVESGDGGVSMLGLTGTEDIGNGTTVQFHLENQFLATNGELAGEGIFNRFSTIAVANDRVGTLTVGHQLFISNAVWDFDPFGQSPWASASLVRGRNWPEANNAVNYASPRWNGFDFAAQYSLSNATHWNGDGTTSQGRGDGLYATYTNALMEVRAMFDETRDANGQMSDVFAYSREYTLAANFFVGPVKLQAAYQASRTSGASSAGGTPTSTDYFWGGAVWQVSTALQLMSGVYHVNANNQGGNATMYGIGGIYSLSKRTSLRAQVATVHNSATANFSIFATSTEGTAVASGNPPTGHGQTGAFIGIMHSF
ncbi:porin [Paraburkholderia bannensis]|uniref:porin n=1 Tax=Paraburkholderia bannensis TaxID=765414 RepID=UPI002AC335D9|nr:porin [Paraburkholderia bannensis]